MNRDQDRDQRDRDLTETDVAARDLALWLEDDQRREKTGDGPGHEEVARSLMSFEESLALFGESARLWAAEREAAHPPVLTAVFSQSRSRHAGRHLWIWSAAVAMLLLMLGVPVWRHQEQAARQRELASDSVLLQQVDEDVSQVVPDALAPLGQSETASEFDSSVPAK
jgi:hypothetical protein